jgi:hypothetical protein
MDRRVITHPRNPGVRIDEKQIAVTGKPKNRINTIRDERLRHHFVQIIHNTYL